MTRAELRISLRTWLVVAVFAVVLTGWPGVVAVLAGVGYLAYRSRPGELVLLGAAGVGLTALVVLLHGLPSRATLSPSFVTDNWPANALAAVSLILATVGVLSGASETDDSPVEDGAAPVGRGRDRRPRARARALLVPAGVVVALGAGFAAVYAAGGGVPPPAVEQQIADRMIGGDGYQLRDELGVDRPTAIRMPVVPVTLAASTAANAPRSAQRVIWALAGTATALAAAAATYRLFGVRSAIVTGGLVLGLPVFVFDHARRDSTALAALLVAALAAVIVRAAKSERTGWGIAAGALGGVLALTRPEGLLIALAMLGVWLATAPASRKTRGGVYPAVVLCALLLVVGPWLLRNRDQVGTWWPTTRVGAVIAGSNTQSTYESGDLLGSYDPAATATTDNGIDRSERRVADQLLRDGTRYAFRHPILAARAAGVRLFRAFELWDGRAERRIQQARGVDVQGWGWRQLSFLVLLGLGAIGVLQTARRRALGPALPLIAGVAAAAIVALLTYGDPVVRSTVDPLIAVAAGAAFARRGAEPRSASSA